MPLDNFPYNPFYLFGPGSISQTASHSPLNTAIQQDQASPAANLMRFGHVIKFNPSNFYI
jgi:hypothetical protein